MHRGCQLLVAGLGLLQAAGVIAQNKAAYPVKPVRVIVASAAGGASDTQGRLFAKKIADSLGQQFIIDNRPGASGTIGYVTAAKAPPDGYTLLVVVPTLTFGPALHSKLPYDPLKDFAPVSFVVRAPYLLVAHPALPAKTLKEALAIARKRPDELSMGATNGSPNHLAAAWFASMAKVKIRLIPYKGIGQVMVDAMSGEIQMMFGPLIVTRNHVQTGRLRALAVSGATRSTVLPDLPTVAESGVPGYDMITWHGWVAPAGTPPAIVHLLSAELAKAVKAPDVVKTLQQEGGEPVGSTPAEFQKLIATEVPRWHRIVKEAGMRIE